MDFTDYKYAPAPSVQAANRLLELRKNGDIWAVIDEIVRIWEREAPSEYESFLITLEEIKQTRKVTNVGSKQFSGVSRTNKGMLRYRLDIPVRVVKMIRALYSPQELVMDTKFYEKLERRFPKFRISEKV
jgi:hypothetical protein